MQQEKGTVEDEDASTTIFIFSNDLSMWAKRLSETDRECWIKTEVSISQHFNSNFSKSNQFYEDGRFIVSQKSNMQEIGYAILKAKVSFSILPAK